MLADQTISKINEQFANNGFDFYYENLIFYETVNAIVQNGSKLITNNKSVSDIKGHFGLSEKGVVNYSLRCKAIGYYEHSAFIFSFADILKAVKTSMENMHEEAKSSIPDTSTIATILHT